MLKESLSQTYFSQLRGSIPIFQAVNAPTHELDSSFKEVLSAFVYSRQDKVRDMLSRRRENIIRAEPLSVRVLTTYSRTERYDASADKTFIQRLLNCGEYVKSLNIYIVSADQPDMDIVYERIGRTMMQYADDVYTEAGFVGMANIHRNEALETFFKQKVSYLQNILVFNSDERTDVFLTCDWTLELYHLFISVIPALMPWLFKDTPLTEDERKLLHIFEGGTSEEYDAIMQKITGGCDFRELIISSVLTNLMKNKQHSERENLEERIRAYRSTIESKYSSIRSIYRDIEDLQDKLLCINRKDEYYDQELADYFMANKALEIIGLSPDENFLKFNVKTYLTNYDPDIAERVITNRDSYLYFSDSRGENPLDSLTADMVEAVFRAVFITNELKLRIRQGFKLCVDEQHIYPLPTGSGWSGSFDETYVPNPHVNGYGCLGSNEEALTEAMDNKGDIIEAIGVCCAITSNFNFADSIVGRYFVEDIFTVHPGSCKCFEDKDGNLYSAAEAYEHLKGKEEVNE